MYYDNQRQMTMTTMLLCVATSTIVVVGEMVGLPPWTTMVAGVTAVASVVLLVFMWSRKPPRIPPFREQFKSKW